MSDTSKTATATKPASKLDTLEKLLRRKNGASITEMMSATGWQQHSVRGALAGAIKKRGHTVTSEKIDGTRRYRIEEAAQ
jgi:transposase